VGGDPNIAPAPKNATGAKLEGRFHGKRDLVPGLSEFMCYVRPGRGQQQMAAMQFMPAAPCRSIGPTPGNQAAGMLHRLFSKTAILATPPIKQ